MKKLDKFEITVDEAVCLVEFLEAEFIQGIGSDPSCADIWYVKNIRSIYNRLQQLTDENMKNLFVT